MYFFLLWKRVAAWSTMFLRLPEPELRELISAFLRCLKENINKGVVMFTGLRFYGLEILKCLGKDVWDSMGNHHHHALYFGFVSSCSFQKCTNSFVKVNIDGSELKKYTNWDKLSCLGLYIFSCFVGNEKETKTKVKSILMVITHRIPNSFVQAF